MSTIIRNDELMHYGIKGMKWGVRKARSINIKVLERKRKKDKTDYIRDQIDTYTKPSGSPGDVYKKAKDNKRKYEAKDIKNTYRIAKQKAKNDPEYKNSDEYKSVINQYGKQRALEILQDLTTTQKKDI